MKKILFLIFAVIFIIGLVNASDDLGTYSPGTNIRITQTCADASYITISSISYTNSNSTPLVTNNPMTFAGNAEYYYMFNQTQVLGRYDVREVSDGCEGNVVNYFTITPSGNPAITVGGGMSLIGGLVVILLVGVFFFILFFKTNNLGLKTVFISFACVDGLIAVLFALVIISQTLGGWTAFVNGFTTFFTVIEILIGISVMVLMLFGMWLAVKFWQFKRGYNG